MPSPAFFMDINAAFSTMIKVSLGFFATNRALHNSPSPYLFLLFLTFWLFGIEAMLPFLPGISNIKP
jgi:hypothetical protein